MIASVAKSFFDRSGVASDFTGNASAGGPGTTAGPVNPHHVYWSYVINSKLDNSITSVPGAGSFMKISQLHESAMTALMVEKMMAPGEPGAHEKRPLR